MELIENVFFTICNNGIYILFLTTLYLLWSKQTLLRVYIIGFVLNLILNKILKIIIKQPRPSEDPKLFNVVLNHSKDLVLKRYLHYDIYGMPSGHAQESFYSTIFIYLTLQNSFVFGIYLLFSLLICFQRIYFRFHSLPQVFVGAVIGSVVSYVAFRVAQQTIKGKLMPRKEDDAPV